MNTELSKNELQSLVLNVARELFNLTPLFNLIPISKSDNSMKMYNFASRWDTDAFLYNDPDYEDPTWDHYSQEEEFIGPPEPIGPIVFPLPHKFDTYKLYVLHKASSEIKVILKTIVPGLITLHGRLRIIFMFYHQTAEAMNHQQHVDLLIVDDVHKQILALHGGMTNYSGEGSHALDVAMGFFRILDTLGIVPVEDLRLNREAGVMYTQTIIDWQRQID